MFVPHCSFPAQEIECLTRYCLVVIIKPISVVLLRRKGRFFRSLEIDRRYCFTCSKKKKMLLEIVTFLCSAKHSTFHYRQTNYNDLNPKKKNVFSEIVVFKRFKGQIWIHEKLHH